MIRACVQKWTNTMYRFRSISKSNVFTAFHLGLKFISNDLRMKKLIKGLIYVCNNLIRIAFGYCKVNTKAL